MPPPKPESLTQRSPAGKQGRPPALLSACGSAPPDPALGHGYTNRGSAAGKGGVPGSPRAALHGALSGAAGGGRGGAPGAGDRRGRGRSGQRRSPPPDHPPPRSPGPAGGVALQAQRAGAGPVVLPALPGAPA